MPPIRFTFDASELSVQADQLVRLMALKFPDGVPQHAVGDLLSLGSDVVLRHNMTTVSADGTRNVAFSLRLGGGIERFSAALGASEWDISAH